MTTDTTPKLPSQDGADVFGASAAKAATTAPADTDWYFLQMTYNDNNGKKTTGFCIENTTNYWNNYLMVSTGPTALALRFRKNIVIKNPDGKEWIRWQLGNGRFLSVRDGGWMKSQIEGVNPPLWYGGFDGNYSLINDWNNYPVSAWYQSTPFENYYYWLYAATQSNASKCEWVKASLVVSSRHTFAKPCAERSHCIVARGGAARPQPAAYPRGDPRGPPRREGNIRIPGLSAAKSGLLASRRITAHSLRVGRGKTDVHVQLNIAKAMRLVSIATVGGRAFWFPTATIRFR